MRNKNIDLFLIILIILLFISYFLIRNQIYGNKITISLNIIEKHIKDNQWDSAKEIYNILEANWRNFRFLLLLNYGAEEYLTFYNNLDRINAGIEAEDKGLALANIKMTKRLWHNFNKIVPEP